MHFAFMAAVDVRLTSSFASDHLNYLIHCPNDMFVRNNKSILKVLQN